MPKLWAKDEAAVHRTEALQVWNELEKRYWLLPTYSGHGLCTSAKEGRKENQAVSGDSGEKQRR